jgi:hypothetical protein
VLSCKAAKPQRNRIEKKVEPRSNYRADFIFDEEDHFFHVPALWLCFSAFFNANSDIHVELLVIDHDCDIRIFINTLKKAKLV